MKIDLFLLTLEFEHRNDILKKSLQFERRVIDINFFPFYLSQILKI